ncbi:unnamed protein product [Anisakis simplex]|uniref:Peptidase S1 domain-containing protein n=1 Tax=Anisakis simplex TaxID=6269 RepID=A0A0M3K0J4_ANISI|nr:unnamed protein product [Anisakis simplex]
MQPFRVTVVFSIRGQVEFAQTTVQWVYKRQPFTALKLIEDCSAQHTEFYAVGKINNRVIHLVNGFQYGDNGIPSDDIAMVLLPDEVPFTCEHNNRKLLSKGDSGSPLMCEKNGARYVLGVAAFTSKRKSDARPLCADEIGADKYGFFDDIRQHLKWIRNELVNYELFDGLKANYQRCAIQ